MDRHAGHLGTESEARRFSWISLHVCLIKLCCHVHGNLRLTFSHPLSLYQVGMPIPVRPGPAEPVVIACLGTRADERTTRLAWHSRIPTQHSSLI